MVESSGIRAAVVGCGYWGTKHLRALASLQAVDGLVAVEPSQERAFSLVRTFPGIEVCPSVEQVLDRVDALVIATPPSTHKSVAMTALEAGKHVLVEKPFATTSIDARAMIAAAEAHGVTLMVGHTFEYHAAVWSIRAMIQSGELGELYYLDTARLNLGLYQHDVNVLYDLAPHDISILNYVLGAQPVSVECWASRHAHRQLEDIGYLRLYYDKPGVFANVHVSWLDPCKVRRVTVVGSKKMVVFDDLATEERIRIHDKGVLQLAQSMDDLTQPPMSYRYGDVVTPYLAMNEPLSVEDEHFLDCVLTGMRPETDGENGLAVVEVLECAQRSSLEGRAVDIAEVRQQGVVQ